MSENNKNVLIVLSGILIAGFFMPWLKYFVSLSAWDISFENVGKYIDSPLKYLLLLIPITGVVIIYAAGFNNGNYPISHNLLFRLPLLTLCVLLLLIVFKVSGKK